MGIDPVPKPKKYIIRNAAGLTYVCGGPLMPSFDVDRAKAEVFDTAEDARAIKSHFSPQLDNYIVYELTDDGREIPV